MNTKTPIMVLQELLIKRNESAPLYRHLDNDADASNTALFRCSVETKDVFEVGTGRTKKDAKQKAAFLALEKLQKMGIYSPAADVDDTSVKMKNEVAHSSAADLKDICAEYQLAAPVYDLLSESGPPHSKLFTIKCKVGAIEKVAIDSTKKAARQKAAALVLEYFQNNVPQRIKPNIDSLAMMDDLAKTKYSEVSTEVVWRPNLGQIIAEYPWAFKNSLVIEKGKVRELQDFLNTFSDGNAAIPFVEEVFKKIPLEFHWDKMPSQKNVCIHSFQAPHANPPIAMLGLGDDDFKAKNNAAIRAITYVKIMLSI